jgi:hypothetical protein
LENPENPWFPSSSSAKLALRDTPPPTPPGRHPISHPMSFSLTGVDDEATQRCFAHIHDRVRATLVRGEPVTVAGGHPVRRTLKLLRALARGHWIVGEEYFTSPRARGIAASPSTPPPSRTEEGMLPHVPGAQLSRLSGGGRALAGLTVTLRGATVYFKSPLKPYLALF